jgi:hypothetical protein
MSPAEIVERIAALDWSATSLQHQLAVGAAVETLKGMESVMTESVPIEVLSGVAINQIYQNSNVIALPVRPRTCWTTICHLDGREWARSSHFGPEGAWGWIVESVAAEHGVSEDQVGSLEGSEESYDGDDLVTIDGLPVYRIQHLC